MTDDEREVREAWKRVQRYAPTVCLTSPLVELVKHPKGQVVTFADHESTVRELREALKQWQTRFHRDSCYAGEYDDDGKPLNPRRWCDLCKQTNAALGE